MCLPRRCLKTRCGTTALSLVVNLLLLLPLRRTKTTRCVPRPWTLTRCLSTKQAQQNVAGCVRSCYSSPGTLVPFSFDSSTPAWIPRAGGPDSHLDGDPDFRVCRHEFESSSLRPFSVGNLIRKPLVRGACVKLDRFLENRCSLIRSYFILSVSQEEEERLIDERSSFFPESNCEKVFWNWLFTKRGLR